MVTIDPEKSIQNITGRNGANSCPRGKKGEFDEIFRKTVDSTGTGNTETESTRFVSDIRPARFASEPTASANMVVDRVRRLIDTMDVYRQKLAEEGATLKDIHGLVQEMESQSDSLAAVSDAVKEEDGLETIINQALVLSSMEIARFNNGHYNDG